jgi:endonuclease/exonuclease/phosphatase (EEP) superfamily protein YafD
MGPIGLRVLRSTVPPVDDDATLTVLSCNIRYGTASPERLLAWIGQVDPDVILLQEYDHPFPAVVRESLQARYPHVWQEPGGAHGQAIISRLPFEALAPDVFDRRWKMTAPRATVELQGRRVDITNVHVYPPMRFDLLQAQLQQLDVLATETGLRVGRDVDAVLLVGDFNAPWRSNHLRPLARLGLNEAHVLVGRGRGATWGPPSGPLSLAPGIRIDNAIFGGALEPVWSVVGPDVGSDHRPIAAGFRWVAGATP